MMSIVQLYDLPRCMDIKCSETCVPLCVAQYKNLLCSHMMLNGPAGWSSLMHWYIVTTLLQLILYLDMCYYPATVHYDHGVTNCNVTSSASSFNRSILHRLLVNSEWAITIHRKPYRRRKINCFDRWMWKIYTGLGLNPVCSCLANDVTT